jgi:DNA-binding response OmpR family regulator
MVTRVRVLVDSPDPATAEFLQRSLKPERFQVVAVGPTASFVEVARHERPEIAVLDWVQESPEAAQLKIAVLKGIRPQVRIIAMSERPSMRDARIVEEGIFYYFGAMIGTQLVRVVEAAAGTYPNQAVEESIPNEA